MHKAMTMEKTFEFEEDIPFDRQYQIVQGEIKKAEECLL